MTDELQGRAIEPLKKGEKVGMSMALYAGRLMPETFGQVVEFAQMMCKAGLAIPKHLRDQPGICMSVIQRSLAWEMDPWGVATKTYAVNDILAFESQLIAAVVKKWAPIKEKVIPYKFTGDGPNLVCSITLHHAETGEEISYETPKLSEITPKNAPLWKSDPRQQIGYYAIRALARRHFPEILMGVYDREEVAAMRDITPAAPVDNYLNDDAPAVDGEVLFPASSREAIRKAQDDMATFGTGAVMVTEKGASHAPIEEVQVTPDMIAANLEKAIRSHTDKRSLEKWQHENAADLNALPADLSKRVRAVLFDRHVELEEL